MTGSELLMVGAAAKGIEALITDTTKTVSNNTIVSTIKGLKARGDLVVFNASQKYVENYQKRHCQLKVLGMREPVNLSDVYTGVKLLDDSDIWQFDPNTLEETFRGNRLRGYAGSSRSDKKQSGLAIANQKQYIMVLGGPGAGKSTFLRKVGLEALRTFYYENAVYKPRLIPVLLELKRFEKEDVDIEKFITTEFETCGFPEAATFTRNALVQGNLLVLLDGLDEVPSVNLDNVLNTIQDFVDCYDQNRFISSCRVAASGYRGRAFRRFSNVTMADFDDEQIQQFIGNWFSNELDTERKTAEKCWEVLQKPENKASKELAHTPLLLTYLCLVYAGSQRFPNNRSSLYKKALRILLEEWAAEKRIQRDDIYEGLSIEQEEILLSEIAFDGMKNDQLFFDRGWLSRQIKTFLNTNLNASKTLDSEAVLNAIEVQQGILVKRLEDQYSFSHLTLQEYLSAQYLIDNREWSGLVQKNITGSRWREIFLLLPGLMMGRRGADSFLKEMQKQADTRLDSPGLKALLHWVESATNKSTEKSKPSENRITAICLALNFTRTRARAYDRVLSLDLARALSLARTRDPARASKLDLSRDLGFVPDLALTLASALDLDLDLNFDFNFNFGSYTLEGDFNLDHDLQLQLQLTRELDHLKIFNDADLETLGKALEHLKDNEHSKEVTLKLEYYESVVDICDAWLSALGVEFRVIGSLSLEDVQALSDYFYIYELIVRCKEGATRVSPNVWKSIESRILVSPSSAE